MVVGWCRLLFHSSKVIPRSVQKYTSCHVYGYITYYLIKVAASSFNTPLERRAPNGRPPTVLYYYTVLIKDLIENTALKFKNCAQHFNDNTNNT